MARVPLLLIIVCIGLPVVARAQHAEEPGEVVCIPDPAELVADGMVTAPDLEPLRAHLLELGPKRCAEPLARFMQEHTYYVVARFGGEVFEAWGGDPTILYGVFGRAALHPRGRQEDVALEASRAIRALVGEGSLLGRVASDEIASDWLALAADRYLEEWRPELEQRGISAPPVDEAWILGGLDHFRACLADPALQPADPFDPLGVVQGPAAELGVGTRCASAAALHRWEHAAPAEWSEAVRDIVRRYSQSGAFHDLALDLERRWGQGEQEDGVAAPALPGPYAPAGRSVRGLLGGAALLALLLTAWVASRLGRDARFRLAALAFGIGLVGAVEGVLGLVGVPPGDELRPRMETPLQGGGQGALRDLRRRPFAVPRPPSAVRLAVVGASSVAGPNLATPETISGRLEARLRESVPCVEVANLGQHGTASPGLRSLAVAAADELDVDAVVVYGGHNEVANMRERNRFAGRAPVAGGAASALRRTHLYGLLLRFRGSGDGAAVGGEPEPAGSAAEEVDYEFHNPRFEAAVSARFEEELVDLVRALERRNVKVVLSFPSFNHHGLRVRPLGAGAAPPGEPPLDEQVTEALRAGDGPRARAAAARYVSAASDHPAPWFLAALALELDAAPEEAEVGVWEASRRNQVGSAVTPGIASALRRVADRYGVAIADAHGALHRAAAPHLPGFDLFTDYVHLNPRGADVVAQSMEAALRESGVVDSWRSACASPTQR